MKNLLNDKLEKIIYHVDMLMVDPDIDIEYCIPGLSVNHNYCKLTGGPYLSVRYIVGDYTQPARIIHLSSALLNNPVDVIVDVITVSIQDFKMQIDSVEMG